MEKIFELSNVGDLFLEHTFYMLDDEPILFVCKGLEDIRFLCSCCRLYEKWVVGQVTATEIINLIDDKVSIREVFEQCDTKFVVKWDGEKFEVDGDVHDGLLPKTGALLELDSEKCGVYREDLVKHQKQWQSIQLAVQLSNKILSEWKQHQEMYERFLQELRSLEPVISEVSRVISYAISVQLPYLTHSDTDYWEKLAQCVRSISTVTEADEKGEQAQKQDLSVKQATETYSGAHNQAFCNDEIQYLAA